MHTCALMHVDSQASYMPGHSEYIYGKGKLSAGAAGEPFWSLVGQAGSARVPQTSHDLCRL